MINHVTGMLTGKPVSLRVRGQCLSGALMEGNSYVTVRWPLAAALAAIAEENSVELELDSALGTYTIFTSTDQMLIEMTATMQPC